MNFKQKSQENILQASETLTEPIKSRYISFMEERFGDSYTDIHYAKEWATRIAESKFYLMDSESEQAWVKIMEKENGKK